MVVFLETYTQCMYEFTPNITSRMMNIVLCEKILDTNNCIASILIPKGQGILILVVS